MRDSGLLERENGELTEKQRKERKKMTEKCSNSRGATFCSDSSRKGLDDKSQRSSAVCTAAPAWDAPSSNSRPGKFFFVSKIVYGFLPLGIYLIRVRIHEGTKKNAWNNFWSPFRVPLLLLWNIFFFICRTVGPKSTVHRTTSYDYVKSASSYLPVENYGDSLTFSRTKTILSGSIFVRSFALPVRKFPVAFDGTLWK